MINTLRIHYKGYSDIRQDHIYYIVDIDKDMVFTQGEKSLKEIGIKRNFDVIKENPTQLFYL